MRLRLPASLASPPVMAPGQAEMPPADLDSKPVQHLFRQELSREVQNRPGYRPDDRIGPFRLILQPFSTDNGMLTQTLKIKRPVVMERYRDMINGMFS
jgi:long-chain acyl-CoA synthetase